jgi:hypothetical protein
MPGDMTIKSSLLGEILEELACLRMNITIRLDDDREEGDPVCSAYILIFIDYMLLLRYVAGGVGKVWYNSQEDDGEEVKWGYEILERLGRWKCLVCIRRYAYVF